MTTDDAPRPALDAATLERLRGLLHRATPGEWWTDYERTVARTEDGEAPVLSHELCPAASGLQGWTRREDADLIVLAHNALPGLLAAAARADALTAEREWLRGALFAVTKAVEIDEAVMIASAALVSAGGADGGGDGVD